MKPQTERLQREFDDVVRQGSALVERLDDAALQRRPEPDAWSVAECVDQGGFSQCALGMWRMHIHDCHRRTYAASSIMPA